MSTLIISNQAETNRIYGCGPNARSRTFTQGCFARDRSFISLMSVTIWKSAIPHTTSHEVMTLIHQDVFRLTLRAMSAGFLLSTMYIMTVVMAESEYLKGHHVRVRIKQLGASDCLPCKYILKMIIPEVDFCWSSNWYSFCFTVVSNQKVGFCQTRVSWGSL